MVMGRSQWSLKRLIAPSFLNTLQAQEIAFFELCRRQLVVETVPAFWVVELLDVIESISESILPGTVDLSPDLLPLQQLEKAFGHRIVMAVATSTHAARQLVGFQEALPIAAIEMTTLSERIIASCSGLRHQTAISNASIARSLVICGFIDQAITRRENRSIKTAKNNQLSSARM